MRYFAHNVLLYAQWNYNMKELPQHILDEIQALLAQESRNIGRVQEAVDGVAPDFKQRLAEKSGQTTLDEGKIVSTYGIKFPAKLKEGNLKLRKVAVFNVDKEPQRFSGFINNFGGKSNLTGKEKLEDDVRIYSVSKY